MKNLIKMATIFLVGLSLLSMQSCSSIKPINKAQLQGYWVLKTMETNSADFLFEGPTPNLKFDFEKNMVSGSGGCNRYSGGFTLSDKNEFSAPNLASTMMACMNKNSEPDFLKLLSTNAILEVNGDMLTFTQNGKIVLQFAKGDESLTANARPESVTKENIVGEWVLKSMGSEDIVKLFPVKMPTMILNVDGQANGYGGCNNYRSNYTLTGNTFTFTPPMSTRMAGPGLEGEGKFTSLLASPMQATITGDVLTFLKDGSIVMEFTKVTAE